MNRAIIAVVSALVIAQTLKIFLYWYQHREFSWCEFVATGGMPSSHSAIVVSLATIVYLQEGLSTSFVVSLVVALMVIRDAFGVRRSVGEEGQIINRIMKKLRMNADTHFSMGHTPLQVLVGSVIGFVTALVFFFL
jgi:hypothetical protein